MHLATIPAPRLLFPPFTLRLLVLLRSPSPSSPGGEGGGLPATYLLRWLREDQGDVMGLRLYPSVPLSRERALLFYPTRSFVPCESAPVGVAEAGRGSRRLRTAKAVSQGSGARRRTRCKRGCKRENLSTGKDEERSGLWMLKGTAMAATGGWLGEQAARRPAKQTNKLR